MDRENAVDRFYFNDNLFSDHNVQPIGTVDSYIFVNHRQRNLSIKQNSTDRQFMTKAFFVCGFQKSGPQVSMDLNSRANNLIRQIFVQHDCYI